VRFGVARNTNTPSALLAQLASDTDSDVREEVVRNDATPAAVLMKLSADGALLQCAVGWLTVPRPSSAVLEKMSTDGHPVGAAGRG
jgi:hypothetical protein